MMKKEFFAFIGALLAGTGLAFGQSSSEPPHSASEPAVGSSSAVEVIEAGPSSGLNWSAPTAMQGINASQTNADMIYANAEYLLWWFKDGRLPGALITTGSNSDNPGALGHGGASRINRDIEFDQISGVRATLGMWLDSDDTVALEVAGFILPRHTTKKMFQSDATGNPVLAFRYLDAPVNGVAAEDAFQASSPVPLSGGPPQLGPYTGSLGYSASTRLWGTEANLVTRIKDSHWQLLGGFRYVDLDEQLDLNFERQAIAGTGSNVMFQGSAFPAPSAVSSLDSFRTRNQFYGGQVGARGQFCLGKLILGLSGKVALGENHEVENTFGTSTLSPGQGSSITVAGGQFAAATNMGRTTHDQFGFIPELEAKLSYPLTGKLRAYVGYDLLYWNQTVRPGSQVDLIVDTKQDQIDPAFTGEKTAFPRPRFEHSDFWAQGIDFGLEFSF